MNNNKSFVDKFTAEELKEFYIASSTLKEFYKKLGYANADAVRDNIKLKINQKLSLFDLSIEKFKMDKVVEKEKKYCLFCGKPVNNKFCSNSCRKKHNDKLIIEEWKKTGNTRCKPQTTIRNCIRTYIYEKQNYKCAICGIENTWNSENLNFILDHIDGNAENGKEENLRLICPNCDSQLPTYKSRNKNSARKHRHSNI